MCLQNRINKVAVLFFAFTFVALSIAMSTNYTLAASTYKGSGTKESPYLVETAAQLDGIRNNLSAHYKLANTIDLSTISDFKPIGFIAKPFTGSFVCDSDTNGNSLFAIKNLKMAVKDTVTSNKNWYKNWVEGVNRMEAGLFGATKGASFKNIILLNINVSNDNFGDNKGGWIGGQYFLLPGQDEKNTAGLIGDAKSTTVSGCVTTGQINTKSNHAGGLIGYATSCTITTSYSTVNTKSTGLWCIGGLIGTSKNTTVNQCYATGDINSVNDTTGGLIGTTEGGVVTSCYSTGNITKKGRNFTGRSLGASITNCYTTGNGGAFNEKDQMTFTTKPQNCFSLSGKKNVQPDFKSASKAEILAAFGSIRGWTATGVDLPMLSSIKTVKKDSEYVQSVVQETTQSGNSGGTTAVGGTTNAGGGEASSIVGISDFLKRLSALPSDPEAITINHKDTIKQLKKDYDSLSDGDSAELTSKDIGKMTMLYQSICSVMVGDIVKRIEALPQVDKLKSADKKIVLAINEDYIFLSNDAKEAIDSDLRDRLEKSVAAVKAFSDEVSSTVIESKLSSTEWAIVIVLSVFIAGCVAGNAFMTVIIIKKKQSKKG